ncbi:hypothetical protein NIES932_00210 [Raphidiopsis curvata NIES-932]|uniref:COP23 domain-containing protein n=1 Tax=Cylindrospermopsis raciborskii TaxID=77022 RepID=UPI000B603602|nr:hypothetical protein NIES932_00210 [Raphidiopsis curvata NIES-932]
MKLTSLSTGLSITLVTLNVSIGSSQAQYTQTRPNQVRFSCEQLIEPSTGERIPMTVAFVPERQGYVRVIAWKSHIGRIWSPEKRCNIVSGRFQSFFDAGKLNFLTYGNVQSPSKNGGTIQVICAVNQIKSVCDNQNQLFTIKNTEEPDQVLESLIDTVTGKTTSPIWQSSDKNRYLDVKSYLNQVPLIDISQ